MWMNGWVYREHEGVCCGDCWVDVQQWATTNTGANLDRLGNFNNSHPSCSLHHNFMHSCIKWLSRIVMCLHSYMLSYSDKWFYWGSHVLCKVWAKRCYFFKNGPQTPVRGGGSVKESVFGIRLTHTSWLSSSILCLHDIISAYFLLVHPCLLICLLIPLTQHLTQPLPFAYSPLLSLLPILYKLLTNFLPRT